MSYLTLLFLFHFFFQYFVWDQVYEFARRTPRQVAQDLPRGVLRELAAAFGVGPYLRCRLSLPYFRLALMTDASPTGGAVVVTEATDSELRENGRLGTRAMWIVENEEISAEVAQKKVLVVRVLILLDVPKNCRYTMLGTYKLLQHRAKG